MNLWDDECDDDLAATISASNLISGRLRQSLTSMQDLQADLLDIERAIDNQSFDRSGSDFLRGAVGRLAAWQATLDVLYTLYADRASAARRLETLLCEHRLLVRAVDRVGGDGDDRADNFNAAPRVDSDPRTFVEFDNKLRKARESARQQTPGDENRG